MSTHMLSMPIMPMGAATSLMAASQTNIAPKNIEDNSPGTCCDAIGSFSLACDFIATQFVRVIVYGGSERVVFSTPVVQSTYIEAVSPPPKA